MMQMFGIGLDHADGIKRITRDRDNNITLVGGSQDTHTNMFQVTRRFVAELGRRGLSMDDLSMEELVHLIRLSEE